MVGWASWTSTATGSSRNAPSPRFTPITRGATNRRSGVGQDRAVPGEEVRPADRRGGAGHRHDDADRDDGDGPRQDVGPSQDRQPGEDEPTRLADEQDADRDAAEVAVEPAQQPRDEQLGRRERERQDADDGGDRRMRAERQEQRDRQPVAGQGGDRRLADADAKEPSVARTEEHAPFVDRGSPAPRVWVGHQLPIAGPYQTLAAMIR